MEDEKDGALLHPPGLLGRLHRQLAGPAGEAGSAERPGWAEVAQGRPVGQADGGPQLHHGLIEVAGGVQGDDLCQGGGHPLFGGRRGDVPLVSRDPGSHPQHVAVHRRDGEAEGDGGDGPGGVVPHAGQGADLLIGGGKDSSVLLHDLTGSPLQVSGPAVIAQSLPQLHQCVLRDGSQVGHRRQSLQKAAVVVQHSGHPGLLEHDLRHPHPVGRGVAAPGQHPGVLPVPQQQGDGQLLQLVHSIPSSLIRFPGIIHHGKKKGNGTGPGSLFTFESMGFNSIDCTKH